MKGEFALYPEERHWWSFSDHRAVLQTVQHLHPQRVLEFGPGSSTLALLEGGAQQVDACEDNPRWAAIWEDRLARRFPDQVTIHRYTWADPLVVPSLQDRRYDLALIDGPRETLRRPAVLAFALDRCSAVLMPAEEWKCTPYLRPIIEAMAAARRRRLHIWDTGPHSGAFALIGEPC